MLCFKIFQGNHPLSTSQVCLCIPYVLSVRVDLQLPICEKQPS